MQIGSSTSYSYPQSPGDVPVRRTPDPVADDALPDDSADVGANVSADVGSNLDKAADTSTDKTGIVSPMKELAAGALGLDSPDAPETDTNAFYTAGKVIAAAVTIGKIISLFV